MATSAKRTGCGTVENLPICVLHCNVQCAHFFNQEMNGALPTTVARTAILATLLPARSNPEVMCVTGIVPVKAGEFSVSRNPDS